MITLKNISKKFGEHEILNNFSHEFEAGKAYGLVGASGSGKTTLLNIIGKLEKSDVGEILIGDRKLKDIKEQLYFRDIVGYLFQNYGLIDNETIEQNLALAFVGKKIKKSEQKKIMIQTLEKVNLAPDLKRKIYSLSGGEAQRVAIAKVMIKNPPLILADEPTASLDSANGKEVIELILGLLDKDKTIIIATHTPYVWERMNELVNL
ncbi:MULTISPECIES: putative bacteriocin export ABC transporter [unclassified Lactococcus]|uniref:putative bacteriocin export ABC transporter n=1 Tax=unclassified Lactococcus TaxID=2643510 RepID=UPI0011CCD8FA|nr:MULTISPECIES: putative bacteriocin export ABC transporter [unclassified Lactococcus]MQW22888.1 ATP-binding cassette domain-containing protein [Lactococcus sp. dk101]TXK44565.1 ATP-binding cassette domain-containing protein [Lactococcus sp. dk310]TXK50418.1 ATP-binding cassette domain-containing protein [Lactococcus sp. dk322]